MTAPLTVNRSALLISPACCNVTAPLVEPAKRQAVLRS
jgi:hypothetical protein